MEKLAIGMLLGGIVGALAVTNSRKVQALVKKGQDEVLTRIDDIVEEKLGEMDKKADEQKPKKRAAKKAEQKA